MVKPAWTKWERKVKVKVEPTKSRKASVLIFFLKSFKVIFALVLLCIFIYLVVGGIQKMQNKEMSFSSSTSVEDEFTAPSMTICITMDQNFTNGWNNQDWLEPYKYDFSFPFPDLGVIHDKSFSGFKNLNNLTELNVMNINDYQKLWTPSIQGLFGEPARCFTYQPLGPRNVGFANNLAFRIKSLDDPAIAMQIYVHNHGAMVPHLAKIYGNDFQTVFARIGSFIGNGFEISRTNYTELNREDFECSDDRELYHDAHPGWVKSPDGPKNLEDCIEEYFHRELECLLPWAKNKTFKLNGKIPRICNLSSEFVHYKSLIDRLDSASAMSYWKLIGCIPRCSYTKYSLNVLWDSNFDLLEYFFKQVDGSNMEFFVTFVQSEIQILKRIWIYDFSNLLADIGGFLGLLLGASIYTFADLLVASVQKFVD